MEQSTRDGFGFFFDKVAHAEKVELHRQDSF